MRWQGGRKSGNVEDRRGMSGGRASIGCGTIILALVAIYFGVDPSFIIQAQQNSAPPSSQKPQKRSPQEDKLAEFTSVVLADTEDTWKPLFRKMGKTYKEPKLVLFTDVVRSACGRQSAATGPFYCPPDQQVYIDLGFFTELQRKFKAPGDFAQAYVIAHEVGHHIQNLLGTSDRVHAQRSRMSKAQGNELSVRQELQADCFAGVWAHHADKARSILERGDVEEAMRAATAIGDDRMQMQSRGYVSPESFTHGTSAQRVRWFNMGLKFGAVDKCDTFSARTL